MVSTNSEIGDAKMDEPKVNEEREVDNNSNNNASDSDIPEKSISR
ncbi:25724_t:CDS:2 [Dentiscutata erythropus]|uniref:25724_t:CDS:1 n=1 Tax=Dentiscutata erythropus TaxID=1348616 RepID=A0A9N9NDZ7_9GLOM|nr:25724_t:CDS:2 [Dentiscutata erythropus]